MATDAELGWIAGFFDGEGHVSYRRSTPSKHGTVTGSLQVSIPQNADNREVLDKFLSIVGFGDVKGPYREDKVPVCVYTCKTEEVQKLLIILMPNLGTKKIADFQYALMRYYTHDTKSTEEDIRRAVKRKQKKGCPECNSKWNGIFCFECGYLE